MIVIINIMKDGHTRHLRIITISNETLKQNITRHDDESNTIDVINFHFMLA